MVVFQLGEEAEGIALLLSGIEEDNLVTECLVEFFVFVEEGAGAQVGVHAAYAIEEDVGAAEFVHFADVLHNAVVDVLHEALAVGLDDERFLNGIGLLSLDAGVVFQAGGVFVAEGTVFEIGAEFFVDVQGKDVDVVCRTQDLLLDVGNLFPHFIFFLRRVQVHEKIIEEVPVGGVLELLAA